MLRYKTHIKLKNRENVQREEEPEVEFKLIKELSNQPRFQRQLGSP